MPSPPIARTQAYALTTSGTLPRNSRTRPTLGGPASVEPVALAVERDERAGQDTARGARVQPYAPTAGPPPAFGAPNVLCSMNMQASKPSSAARIFPITPLKFAWS